MIHFLRNSISRNANLRGTYPCTCMKNWPKKKEWNQRRWDIGKIFFFFFFCLFVKILSIKELRKMEIMRTYLTETMCKYVLTTPNICDVIFAPHRVYWTRNTISNVRWFICGSYYINIFYHPLLLYLCTYFSSIWKYWTHKQCWYRLITTLFLRWEISSYSVWTQMRSFYFLIVRRDLWSDYFLLKPLSQFAH